jgi:ABC-type transporter Mla subunit MlaD
VRRVFSALAFVALAVGLAVTTGASGSNTSGTGKTYKIDFDNAFGLTSGGDLKIGGVRAGQTTGFGLKKIGNGRYVAEVTGTITASGVSAFHKDASCDIRPQSLIGEYFVDCQPGSSKQMLPPGGTVPVSQTTSTIPPDLMQDIMRRPYRERFRLIINELGTGLAGRPQDLSAVLHRADPGLRETSKTLELLARQNQTIKNFITNSDIVVKQLADHKFDVAHWVQAAGHTAAISATREQALAQQWKEFPNFLAQLQPTMAQLSQLADAQIPLLKQVRGTTPQLKQFFADLGPFSEASRPSFKALGQMSVIGNKAFKDSKKDINELAALAPNTPSAAKNVRQFLQALDSRDRSIENDPRAKTTAPPAPDPTAYHDGQGFTGFESLLNYTFWQSLALNPFDQVGHLLRVALVVNSCSPWQTGPVDDSNKALFAGCNSWLGPNQPGVTTPDPTAKNYDALVAAAKKSNNKALLKQLLQKPATKPLPGQDNPSVPHVQLPQQVQNLLNQLPSLPSNLPKLDANNLPGVGNVPGNVNNLSTPPAGSDNSSNNDKLLNFLLSP